jgi:O-antigen/teichoic acid export membrane protein
MSRLTIVKSAFANLCRLGLVALVGLMLPPFLTRILSKDAYGTWLLILQLSTYVSFFDLGIQTTVGRFVAHCNELGHTKQRDSAVSTSLAILMGLSGLAMVGISILAWQLPQLFKEMPVEIHQDARLALLFVGYSMALALPFSVFGGIFIGLQRYDVPAWITGISRLLAGTFVVLAANVSHSIVLMAMVMAVVNISAGIWQFLAYRKVAGDIRISHRLVSKRTGVEIAEYCFGLSVWTISMILISGLDTAIIGYFDYKSLVYYVLAASLTNFVVSIQSAIMNVIIPKAAAIGARGDRASLGQMLILTTRYGVIIQILTSLPLILAAKSILTLWVGLSYAIHITPLLQLLVLANFIRCLGSPYSNIAMAVGEQRRIILSPLIEGATNVVVSIVLTRHLGVLGVAIGTIIGGLASIAMHLIYNLPRTVSIQISNYRSLLYAVLKPLLSIIPAIIIYLIYYNLNLSVSLDFAAALLAFMLSCLLLWWCGLLRSERESLYTFISSKIIKIE